MSFQVIPYLGTWYEIAKIPLIFESGCNNAIAYYGFVSSNTISVTNTCYYNNQLVRTINGLGYLTTTPGVLTVTFFGVPSNDVGNYVVYNTDYTTYSIVGNKDFTQLWLLARTPTISARLYYQLLSLAKTLGFDTSQVVLDNNVLY